jgi:hypothetical protein
MPAWYSMMTLLVEALQVVEIRMRRIAAGQGTPDEMFLMMSEKIDAASRARTILMRGGDCNQIVDHYRTIVAANVRQLS